MSETANVTTRLVKVARVREEGVPVGVPARLFYRCPCGARSEVPSPDESHGLPDLVSAVSPYRTRCECGRVFDMQGYVVSGQPQEEGA